MKPATMRLGIEPNQTTEPPRMHPAGKHQLWADVQNKLWLKSFLTKYQFKVLMLQIFLKSQFYRMKSPNLTKLGFSFDNPPEEEFKKIQSMLYTEYHIKGGSQLTIKDQFNIPSTRTLDIIFRLFSIEARTLSEGQNNALMQKRSIPPGWTFKSIYHTSWFGETFHLRSSYEEEFAKMLDSSKTKYFVEHLRIKYYDQEQKMYRIAVPDFFLPESNTIVEVKSAYWLNPKEMQNKKESYRELGYNFHLYLDHVLLENW